MRSLELVWQQQAQAKPHDPMPPRLTPIAEPNGILARLGGGDVSRAVSLCGAKTTRPTPGTERTVLVDSEYHGAVRVTCRFLRLKRGRSFIEFWSAVCAEPR
jgi:hypothetical protein